MTIRIVSLNTFGAPFLSKDIGKRFRLIADSLQGENPDIICLQEVVLYPHLRLLKKLLADYPYVKYKRFLYGPKGGLVIFSKLPLEGSAFINFSDRGSLRNKSLVARIMRYGVLSVRLSGMPITIYNTHLTPNMDVEYTEENRFTKFSASQLAQIARIVQQELKWKRNVIIAGDFNIPHDSFLYEDFLKTSGLRDVFAARREPTYHEEFLPEGKDGHTIDYIFVSASNAAVRTLATDYVIERPVKHNGEHLYLSDHIGLLAHLQIQERKRQDSN